MVAMRERRGQGSTRSAPAPPRFVGWFAEGADPRGARPYRPQALGGESGLERASQSRRYVPMPMRDVSPSSTVARVLSGS
jgi:hypothetical protein